jgi:hypothetical protein
VRADDAVTRILRCAGLLSLGLLASCADGPTAPSELRGVWGGEHIRISIGNPTDVELDCAHGNITDPLTVEPSGRFETNGTFVFETGGPIRIDQVPALHPARYSGSVVGDRMSLTIHVADVEQRIGPFILTRGSEGRLFKCL